MTAELVRNAEQPTFEAIRAGETLISKDIILPHQWKRIVNYVEEAPRESVAATIKWLQAKQVAAHCVEQFSHLVVDPSLVDESSREVYTVFSQAQDSQDEAWDAIDSKYHEFLETMLVMIDRHGTGRLESHEEVYSRAHIFEGALHYITGNTFQYSDTESE